MNSLLKLLLQLTRCTSGTALVEMTIILPVAISLMAGGVDFALALSTQTTADKSVRDAARYLGSLSATTGCPSWAIANAKNLAVTGQLSGGTAIISGWQTTQVSATCVGGVVTVAATVTYQSIILATFLPIAGTYTLSTQHEERQVGG